MTTHYDLTLRQAVARYTTLTVGAITVDTPTKEGFCDLLNSLGGYEITVSIQDLNVIIDTLAGYFSPESAPSAYAHIVRFAR